MVWPDGKPEKRSAGKERRRTSRLFSEGLQLRNRTGSMRQQTKEYPARGKDSGGVWWTAGKEPYADPRLSPRGLPNPAGRFRRGATCGKWRTLAGDTRSVTIFVPEAR